MRYIYIFVYCFTYVFNSFGQIPSFENNYQCFLSLDSLVQVEYKDTIEILNDFELIEWYRKNTTLLLETHTIQCANRFTPFKNLRYSYNSKIFQKVRDNYISNECQFELVVLLMYNKYLNHNRITKKTKKDILKKVTHDIIRRQQTIKKSNKDKTNLSVSLTDVFIELDTTLTASQKIKYRNTHRRLILRTYTDLGLWIRNKWNLAGNSPLSNYFFSIEGVRKHPDDISEVIMLFYHDWLNNNHKNWATWEKEKNHRKRHKLVFGY